jgi:hypothetical protein
MASKPLKTKLSRRNALAAAALVLLPASAKAGVLYPNGYGYVDGSNTTWDGTTSFSALSADSQPDISGTVDWEVFTPAGYAAAFPTSTYVPTAGEYVYAYQAFNVGPAPLSSFSVTILTSGLADNIGSFQTATPAGQDGPITQTLGGESANWTMKVPAGDASWALTYSSPYPPTNLFGSLVDDGNSAFVIPLPSPNPNANTPEPSVVGMMMIAGASALIRRRGCKATI